jgi:heat shock protein HtpX
MAAFGLYTHIQANRRRSILLLIGLFFLVYLLTYAGALIGEAMGGDASLDFLLRAAFRDLLYAAPFVTLGTALWVLIAWKFHQVMIDAITGGREVSRDQQPKLYNMLENMCIARGMPMPKLKVMESDALNAFATGLNEKQYSITVTSGLLKHLDDAEVEAVLGHELTHIRNGDVRMLVIAVVIAGVISFFAELLFRGFFNSGLGFRRGRTSESSGDSNRGKGGAGAAIVIAVVLVAVAYVLSQVIRFALSRSREFLADAGSVELTKNPDAMIAALRKIEGRGELQNANSAIMEMCVDNPRYGFADVFATHPSIDKRIAALVQFAGGHDPGPIALPPMEEHAGQLEDGREEAGSAEAQQTTPPGPWGRAGQGSGADAEATGADAAKPFLPDRPPVELGTPRRGPWVRR